MENKDLTILRLQLDRAELLMSLEDFVMTFVPETQVEIEIYNTAELLLNRIRRAK